MYRATTPTHIFTLPFDAGQVREVRITYQQNDKTVLEKTEADCTMVGRDIKVTLSQEETLQFDANSLDNRVSIQLRVLTNTDQVMASKIVKVFAKACLNEEVLS